MKVKFTQKLAMHLNGGDEFSQLNYDIFADGKPTGIVRVTRTDGSPNYLKTADGFHCGDESFDILEARGVGMEAWLTNHLPAQEPTGESA